MARLNLKTECEYCGLPFGQTDHGGCLKRLRRLDCPDKKDQSVIGRHIRLLSSVWWKRRLVKECPRCHVSHRWKSKDCHAHTRAWVDLYGGTLSRGSKKAVTKADDLQLAFAVPDAMGRRGK
jgi:hypothetical protein